MISLLTLIVVTATFAGAKWMHKEMSYTYSAARRQRNREIIGDIGWN